MAMNVAPFQSTDEFTMAGFNGKISDINSGVDTEITSALSGFARIETGSYVGNGKTGSSNPNTLTFSFVPKILFIFQNNISSGFVRETAYSNMVIMTHVSVITSSYNTSTNFGKAVYLTWDDNNKRVSWYSTASNAECQGNTSGVTYTYIAIG